MTENISDIEKLISILEGKVSISFEWNEDTGKHSFVGGSEAFIIGIQDALITARKIMAESEAATNSLKKQAENG